MKYERANDWMPVWRISIPEDEARLMDAELRRVGIETKTKTLPLLHRLWMMLPDSRQPARMA